jgi:ATP-dependent DNA helicase RecG
MDDEELLRLLAGGESDRVERKESLSDKDRICQAICAFANDLPDHRRPGALFVGIRDDGVCAGLPVTDELLLTLSQLRTNGNIYPFPSMTVQKRTLAGCEVAVVEVQPSDMPPVRFRNVIWVRTGPRRDRATPEDERRLTEKRRARNLPPDLLPVPGATTDDLDLDLFELTYLPKAVAPDVLAENRRDTQHRLASLRFATPDGVPTVLGILAFGRDPRSFIPGAYVQFVRFAGTALTDPIKSQHEIAGPLPEMLQQIDAVLEANVSVAADVVSAATEIQHPDYPIAAIRQLVWNGIMHRSYDGTNAPVRISWFDDRIEIQSPGGPFGQVTVSNFAEENVTDYRNPNLAEAMRTLGYVQRFGIGIPIARSELKKNGNPPLEFAAEPAFIMFVLRRRA